MEQKSNIGPKLIIVCGLPGARKTTHATMLEVKFGAIRFCPDKWIEMLSLDLHDEERRAKIESLQWKTGLELHFLSAPIDVLFERIQRRGTENPPLTLEDLQRCSEIFQAPTAEELALFDVCRSVGIGGATEER